MDGLQNRVLHCINTRPWAGSSRIAQCLVCCPALAKKLRQVPILCLRWYGVRPHSNRLLPKWSNQSHRACQSAPTCGQKIPRLFGYGYCRVHPNLNQFVCRFRWFYALLVPCVRRQKGIQLCCPNFVPQKSHPIVPIRR